MNSFGRRDNCAISEFLPLAVYGNDYLIAFVHASGKWDVAERFMAMDADSANEYAEKNYPGQEWYVLDSAGRNINGGPQ